MDSLEILNLSKQGVLITFVVIFMWVLVKLILDRTDRYGRAARIPLDEFEVVDPRTPREND